MNELFMSCIYKRLLLVKTYNVVSSPYAHVYTMMNTFSILILVEVETDEVKEAKRLELEGVKNAEAGQVQIAMEMFGQAISIAPGHASSYNNRAQALRLQGDVKGTVYKHVL